MKYTSLLLLLVILTCKSRSNQKKEYLCLLAPSLADVQYLKAEMKGRQLEKALITNGFSTVVLGKEGFELFNSH